MGGGGGGGGRILYFAREPLLEPIWSPLNMIFMLGIKSVKWCIENYL